MITGLAAANMRGFDAGLTRPDVGHRNAGEHRSSPTPLTAGSPAGSDLLFLVRANGAWHRSHPGTPAPKEGDTMILPGPAPAVS
jgi:hypothetical protein